MKRLFAAFIAFASLAAFIAHGQSADDKALMEKLYPIILEVESSSMVNAVPGSLNPANDIGMGPPVFGFFKGNLSRLNGPPEHEHHWTFGCWAESPRFAVDPCTNMPIGLHRARWIHNREVLEVIAYDADGNSTLRYLDVSIDPKSPPPPNDPIESLPASVGLFGIEANKDQYANLVHVYGSSLLRLPAGALPAHSDCRFTATFPNRVDEHCTQYPAVPLTTGYMTVDASIDSAMPHHTLTCDAKWKWSKCSFMPPGFYEARWKDDQHTKVVLLDLSNEHKPREVVFEVK